MLRLFYGIFFFCFGILAEGRTQTGNNCDVKAILSGLSSDTIIGSPTNIYFDNASLNSTSYQIKINQFTFNSLVGWMIEPGYTMVSLIASNGTCSDTVTYQIFCIGTFAASKDNPRRNYGFARSPQSLTGLLGLKGGGYLLSGNRDNSWYLSELAMGMLVKTKEEGCIDWARIFPSSFDTHIAFTEESSDGNFYVVSRERVSTYTLNKLDTFGNKVWSHIFTNSNGIEFKPLDIEATPDGGLVLVGFRAAINEITILKIDTDGNMVWQKRINYSGGWIPTNPNLLYKDGAIYLGGDFRFEYNNSPLCYLSKFNNANGDLIWARRYERAGGMPTGFRNMVDADSVIIMAVQGSTNRTNSPSIGGYLKLDTDGHVKEMVMQGLDYVPSTLVGPYNASGVSIVKSGRSFYLISSGASWLALQPGISYSSTVARIDSSYQLRWVEESAGVSAIIYSHGTKTASGGVAIGGSNYSYGLTTDNHNKKLMYKVLGSEGSNPAGYCYTGTRTFNSTPQNISNQIENSLTIENDDFAISIREVAIESFYPEMRFQCPEYIDSCSVLKINGPTDICNISQTYTYKTFKNKECGQPTEWTMADGVQLIQQTDSSIVVRFSKFGRFAIYGTNKFTCVPVQDSIVVLATSKTPPLDLGVDTVICSQNTITLKAGPHFLNYQWQDGSRDSIFIAQEAGRFWVQVTDSCGNVLTDTINISAAPSVPVSLGLDRQKCNADTLRIEAPDGFLSYAWSPDYFIEENNGSHIIVNPPSDTNYIVRVEARPGCYGYDTINVKVLHSPQIDLGSNRSICAGDSVVFDAGAGFASYLWNNQSGGQQFIAKTAGTYQVSAITADGCKSEDIVLINEVLPLPVIKFNNNPVLCEGDTRVLNPGSGFSSYAWNTGSQNSTIQVNSPGVFSVEVTDHNGCKSASSTIIERIQLLPRNFLPPDTVICSYGSIQITPLKSFNSYAWSSGSSDRQILVTAPGEYRLEVTDEENCKGIDTIIVNPKSCMEGFFVPSAFTPNADGLNDLFRPLLFGNILEYKFTVYNRGGQVVFSTNDPSKGWDGCLQGVSLNNDVFVWTCLYLLQGGTKKLEKGTVNLIR